jgi:segregation and condensation protein A
MDEVEETSSGAGELLLSLDGFAGSLDVLLALARTQRIDLASLDLLIMVEQLVAAMQDRIDAPLSRRADWVVTAAWLLLLRSHLMLPPRDPRQEVAAAEADRLKVRLLSLQDVRALASWLDRQPQLGQDVFGRGMPEPGQDPPGDQAAVDRIEFVWACIALFDGDWSRAPLEPEAIYVPRAMDLYSVEEARERIRCCLAKQGDGRSLSLAALLPSQERSRSIEEREQPAHRVRHRSAWTTTLIACLEMTKQGELLVQEDTTQPLPSFRVGALV